MSIRNYLFKKLFFLVVIRNLHLENLVCFTRTVFFLHLFVKASAEITYYSNQIYTVKSGNI